MNFTFLEKCIRFDKIRLILRSRFHYEREMEHFYFIDFFASLGARLDFKRGKINKRKKGPFHTRSENEP